MAPLGDQEDTLLKIAIRSRKGGARADAYVAFAVGATPKEALAAVPAAVRAKAALARITTTTDLDAAATADLVVEAVFEKLEVKAEVFRTLDAICRADGPGCVSKNVALDAASGWATR